MSPRVEQWIGDGLVIIDGHMWHRTRARKASVCVVSGQMIRKGDVQYAPLGNGMNRMHRALATVVDAKFEAKP